MASFDRVAEAAERARGRLRENPKVDQVSVSGVLDGAQRGKEHRVNEAPDPKKFVPHALKG
jgi:hypothetical protein